MIIVKNTRELEELYDVDAIPDGEYIRIVGGLEDKAKYKREPYIGRTTYSARQVKQIIAEMKEIEAKIPSNWSKWQKAKFIYQTLAGSVDYNHDRSTYSNQQSSNLSIILSKKGICAGYALTFKEMMDRQGIECDYVRGDAFNSRGGKERHAWNVLTIDGKSIPVDVTWDSGRMQRGLKQLYYFGNDAEFQKYHIPDQDEKRRQLTSFSNEQVNSIDTNQASKNEATTEEKQYAIKLAIEETYKKFSKQYGEQAGHKQVSAAIKKFIKESNLEYFTRQGRARQSLEQYVSQEDMLTILIDEYINKNVLSCEYPQDILGDALRRSLDKYGTAQAHGALKSYILSGYTRTFYKSK